MSKHTPGPWQTETVDSVVRIHGGVFAGAARAVVEVADVWVPDGENGDAAQVANARLIAAAPDLLEALKEAREVVEGDIETGPMEDEASLHARALLVKIDAAIAKATGGK